jgi:hypothetical protein
VLAAEETAAQLGTSPRDGLTRDEAAAWRFTAATRSGSRPGAALARCCSASSPIS